MADLLCNTIFQREQMHMPPELKVGFRKFYRLVQMKHNIYILIVYNTQCDYASVPNVFFNISIPYQIGVDFSSGVIHH